MWRSIKQPDGGIAISRDHDFQENSEGLNLCVASLQFFVS
jgi:hypothetical protein